MYVCICYVLEMNTPLIESVQVMILLKIVIIIFQCNCQQFTQRIKLAQVMIITAGNTVLKCGA